jgi:hypothetical protein
MHQFAEVYPRKLRILAAVAATLALSLSTAGAGAMASEETVLTVGGAVAAAGAAEGAPVDFDMAALKALPAVSFETSTTWTDGVSTFTGVPLKAVLEATGATGTEIEAIALNNYSVAIPVDSLTDDTPIIAYEIDGEAFPRRDKGPLWIVYPFDKSEEYRNEMIYGRSIWQLRTLTVR